MNKTEYCKMLQELFPLEDHSISKEVISLVKKHYLNYKKEKLPVIWIETNDSGDNNISVMNTTYPYLGQVLTEMIDLLYSNAFMAAQGKDALDILYYVAKHYVGEFTLVVEGAIPVKDHGLYNIIAITEEKPLTALEVVTRLGYLAKYVVAIGTCACFGGVSASRPNITESKGVRDILKSQVINVSGCPVNPDWFIGTLAHLIMYGIPDLDDLGRPKMFYEFTIHRHCQRRSYFDMNQFAKQLGDHECMFSLGCVGPRTNADCPYRLWVNHVNWPVKASTPCIGCTNVDFPDGSTPFFSPLPQKDQD